MRDFHHSVNVLVKAYLNDTLESRNCYACACGNLIAEAQGIKFKKQRWHNLNVKWDIEDEDYYPGSNGACNGIGGWGAIILDNEPNELGAKQIESTGYTIEELKRIENAFEKPNRSTLTKATDETVFKGLMNVVDILADIHGIDLETKEETKKLFKKPELCLN